MKKFFFFVLNYLQIELYKFILFSKEFFYINFLYILLFFFLVFSFGFIITIVFFFTKILKLKKYCFVVLFFILLYVYLYIFLMSSKIICFCFDFK
ncbi:hypothetical protein H8356DRAFT_1640083 [Neocallimastix lanati (nom. inval.)]|nr:hypothetical protein H8356DRAFT_1640083 [Neocallimastix sp. JGI-2020a]